MITIEGTVLSCSNESIGKGWLCVVKISFEDDDGNTLKAIVKHNSYCTAVKGDRLLINQNSKGDCVTKPLVIPSNDEETVIRCMMQYSRTVFNKYMSNNPRSRKFHELQKKYVIDELKADLIISSLPKGEEIADYMDRWCTSGTKLNCYGGDSEMLAKVWYERRILTRFRALDINVSDIPLKPSIESLEKIKKNPYVITSKTIEECTEINERLGNRKSKTLIRSRQIYDGIMSSIGDNSSALEFNKMAEVTPRVYKVLDKYYDIVLSDGEVKNITSSIMAIVRSQPVSEIVSCDPKDAKFFISRTNLDIELSIRQFIDNLLRKVVKHHHFTATEDCVLDDIQMDVVNRVVNSNFFAISGLAGTGKTKIIEYLYKHYKSIGSNVCVASPTGMAASMLEERVGRGSTIHKLIYNVENLDTIILDEGSMISMDLLYQLLVKYYNIRTLVIVGDYNQLYPVQGIPIFKSILQTYPANSVELKKVYRTDKGSILENAHAIANYHNGIIDDFDSFKTDESFVIEEKDIAAAVNDYAPPHSPDNFAFICPFRLASKEIAGMIQRVHTMDGKYFTYKNDKYYVRDIVMILHNNYHLKVYNGVEGKVSEVGNCYMTVKFKNCDVTIFNIDDDKSSRVAMNHYKDKTPDYIAGSMFISCIASKYLSVILSKQDPSVKTSYNYLNDNYRSISDKFCLGSAYTFHKFEGCEREDIIVYLSESSNTSFLSWNMLYVALTRAKRKVHLIGDETDFEMMALRKPPQYVTCLYR